jgi:sugar phosphate isomerase/epimerase
LFHKSVLILCLPKNLSNSVKSSKNKDKHYSYRKLLLQKNKYSQKQIKQTHFEMNRRNFLLNSSLALASNLFAAPSFARSEGLHSLGIQLYSVRDDLKKDPLTTLKKLAEMGYNYVEGYGYSDHKWQGEHDLGQMKELLYASGLSMPSSHFVLKSSDFDPKTNDFTSDFKIMLEEAQAIGQHYWVSSYIVPEDRKDLDAFKRLCEVMNRAGEYCRKFDLKLGYHNHEFEFDLIHETTLMDVMLQEVSPENLSIEMDMGWAVFANQNPVEWFKKYPNRFELSHIKDGNKRGKTEEKHKSCIIGKGDVDFKSIIHTQEISGIRMWIIEIEDYVGTPLDDAKACLENFKNLYR